MSAPGLFERVALIEARSSEIMGLILAQADLIAALTQHMQEEISIRKAMEQVSAARMKLSVTEPNPELLRIVQIAATVADQYLITVDEIRGDSRVQGVVEARYEVIEKLSAAGFAQSVIARFLGRDQSTIRHGLARRGKENAA